MTFEAKPHISAALQHMRFGITTLSVVAITCLLLQVLVWAFVHYTDVQWAETEVRNAHQQEVVVGAEDAARPAPDTKAGAVDINRVESRNGRILRATSAIVQTCGIISVTSLAILMLLAVVIAGGQGIPGVEIIVTAATWSLIIAGFSLPLGSLFPDALYPGVFLSVDQLTIVAEQVHAEAPGAPSGAVYYFTRLILPAALMVGLLLIVIRFRSGVEAGIIVTNVSQLDEKLEKEIRSRRLGELSTPRAVGALHSAIGESGAPQAPAAPAPAEPAKPSGLKPTGTDGSPGMHRPI